MPLSDDRHPLGPIPTALLAAMLSLAPGPLQAQPAAPDSSLARLAPASSAPWNPPRAMAAVEPWETAVRVPGKVASLPFSLLGLGMKGGLIFVEQNDVVPKVVARVSVLTDYGLLAGPASLGDRTGWGGEVGVNPTFLRSFVAAGSASTNGYDRVRVAFDLPQGLLEYQSDWRPRESFFGVGPDSRKDQASNFASQGERARVELRYPFRHPVARVREILDDPATSTETHAPRRPLVRVWAGPRDVILLDGRERTSSRPPLATRFPALAAGQLDTRVEHFVYGAQASLDTRSGRPHWWKGWRASVSGERFDQPVKALAFRDAGTRSVSFTRWTYEGEAGLSFWRDPRTLRAFVRVVDQTGVTGGGLFLIPDLVALGGHEGLGGFEPGRFRDADLVLGRLTYIFPIARYLETDLHVEGGDVRPRLEETRLEGLKTSYGIALRVRNAFAPLACAGVDWSNETVRFRFSIGGVE
jgi:hypothetical protein